MRRVGHDEEREEEEGGEQQREKSVSEGWGESVGTGGRAGVAWRPRKEEWVGAERTAKRKRVGRHDEREDEEWGGQQREKSVSGRC